MGHDAQLTHAFRGALLSRKTRTDIPYSDMACPRALLNLHVVVLFGTLCSCSGTDEGGGGEPWSDEDGAVGEPSGSLSGTIGGASFNAMVNQANFQENQSSFSIRGLDTTTYPGEILSIGLSIDRDAVGVGQFDCSVLGEAGISARIPVADGLGGITTTFVQSTSDFPCTITIDQFGNVGEPITGSFSGTLIETGSQGAQVSGSINAVRGSVVLN